MKTGLYQCDQPNCPGHDTFTATCLTVARQVEDYPVLTLFQNGWDVEQPTEPVQTIQDEQLGGHKSGGRATQEIKQYNNKATFNLKAGQKQNIR